MFNKIMLRNHLLKTSCVMRQLEINVSRLPSIRASSSASGETTFLKIEESIPEPPKHQLILNRKIKYLDNLNLKLTPARQSWVHSFDSSREKRGLIELHPKIFGDFPRPDVIFDNIEWQKTYRIVDWTNMPTVQEMPEHNLKPWPQKGTGRARHGSKRSPQWVCGGWSHGPRGPRTRFYMLNFWQRVKGLTTSLSCKFAQNDIVIVDSLDDFPSDEPEFLSKYLDERSWGPSVLIIDTNDIFPTNISLAAEGLNHVNLMPVYGLNVYSMMKHETLIMTVRAVQHVEEKLMYHLRREDTYNCDFKFNPPPVASETV